MRTSSRLVAALLFDEVELLDVATLLSVLSAAGRQWNFRPFKIVPVARAPGPVVTRSQLRVEAAASVSDHPLPEIVLLPGGYGTRRALADAGLVEWLTGAGSNAAHVVSIGNGTLLAAAAGLITDEEIATTAELAPALFETCPRARLDTVATVHESGKLITAGSTGATVIAALRLVTRVLGEKQARVVAASLGLDLGLASTPTPLVV